MKTIHLHPFPILLLCSILAATSPAQTPATGSIGLTVKNPDAGSRIVWLAPMADNVLGFDANGQLSLLANEDPETEWGSITGTLADQADLQNVLAVKAPLASPTFTGTVTIPSGASISGYLTESAATTTYASLSGSYSNPSWITSLAKSKVGLGNVENAALSTWSGTSTLTTLGTITSGTWQGTPIADGHIASASLWNSKASQDDLNDLASLANAIDVALGDLQAETVKGPASTEDNSLARFNATNGKLLQGSSATLSDNGVLTVGQVHSVSGFIAESGIQQAQLSASALHFSSDPYTIQLKANLSMDDDWTLTLPPNAGDSGQVLATNGSGVTSWIAPGGMGDALTSGTLSQFAPTTSAQLRSVISDESGTGVLLFAGGNLGSATGSSLYVSDYVYAENLITAPTLRAEYQVSLGIDSHVLRSGGGEFNIVYFPDKGGTHAYAALVANSSGLVSLTNEITGTLPLANGGTNATSASAARANLGLVIGTDVLSPNGSGASLTDVGNVTGPTSTTDNALARFDSTTGKLIQSSNATLSDNGVFTISTGFDVSADSAIRALGSASAVHRLRGELLLGVDAAGNGQQAAFGTYGLYVSGAANINLADDVNIYSDGSGFVALRKTTASHGLRIYETWTNPSNYERLSISAASGINSIKPEAAGTGSGSTVEYHTTSTGVRFASGSGTPEGSISAPIGSLHTRTDGSTGSTLYIKESGTGNTGWSALGAGSGTVTSVALSVPAGLTVGGSPITTSGTLTLGYSPGYTGYTTTEQTKLSGIEAAADVTDASNVAAAGAVMEADISTASMAFVIDEDSMASNSATRVPTQQSVKAYVDSASSRPRMAIATSNQTTTSSSPSTETSSALQLSVEAGKTYHFRASLIIEPSVGTQGYGVGITGPASPTLFRASARASQAGTTHTVGVSSSYGLIVEIVNGIVSGSPAMIEGVITPSTTGNLKVIFNTETSAQYSRLLAGSILVVTEVAN